MSFEKYRVHEVAKDFGKQTKDITQILTTYATTPKNHMQVLDDKELSIIFEYLTQHNQVADLQAVFANAPKAVEALRQPVRFYDDVEIIPAPGGASEKGLHVAEMGAGDTLVAALAIITVYLKFE